MRFQVGRCYQVLLHGNTKRFRVVKNENNDIITVRICDTDDEKNLLTEILIGDISDIEISEFDCTKCDGKPSVP